MTKELETAIDRLQALPEPEQARIADRINGYLNKMEDLKLAIQEGLDSGPGREVDFETIKRRGRDRLAEQRA